MPGKGRTKVSEKAVEPRFTTVSTRFFDLVTTTLPKSSPDPTMGRTPVPKTGRSSEDGGVVFVPVNLVLTGPISPVVWPCEKRMVTVRGRRRKYPDPDTLRNLRCK